MHTSYLNKIIVGCLLFISTLISCKKFVEVDPPRTRLVSQSVFTSDAVATSAILGIYSNIMAQTFHFASGGLTLYTGLSADELVNYSTSSQQAEFFNNALSASNSLINSLWSQGYNLIYAANSIIKALENSTSISPSVRQQLLGEAKFVRAFSHFYLVNLWGEVPYITSTDYQTAALVSKLPMAKVYEQIIIDLKDAQSLLAEKYVDKNNSETTERVRPNKWAAIALLARVYLYSGDWPNAEALATSIINNTGMYSLTENLNNVFLKNSSEAIWQMMPVRPSNNTTEGETFILTTTPDNAALSTKLVNLFDTADKRKTSWIKSVTVGANAYYFPYKYKIRTGGAPYSEYYMVLRLGEQFLIRAESRAKQNNITGAMADLNVIRLRAGLDKLSSLTQEQCLLAIEQERRSELFCEWAHRWLDLKRTNRADAILGPVKGPNWQTKDQLYPIPITQISNDPNMEQNAGY